MPCGLSKSGSIMSSNLTGNLQQPACMLSKAAGRGCRATTLTRVISRHANQMSGCPLRQRRRAVYDTRQCRSHCVQRRSPLRLHCLGGSQPIGAGVVSESNIETIDAVDVEVLHLPATDSVAGSLRLKNHEIERLSLDLKSQMLGLEVLTMEDKAKLAKAQMDRRLEKKKAKADHRAAVSQRDADSSQSDRSSSHAQASTSSPDSEATFALQPKKPRVRRSSTSIASTSAAGSKRKVKTTAKAAAEPALPTKAQKRASTRSGRTSAWGKTERSLDTPGGNGVVRARQTSSSSSEQGYGTAVGGLFKMSTHLLTAAQEVELTIHIKELLRCEKIFEELKEQLGRLPHDAEWAGACGASDVPTFISELTVCKDAKKQMIMCNQRLVMSVARKYVNRGMEMPDLIAEGIVGLVKAVDRFDHTRGFKFSTYSHWWIRQAMNRAICEQGRIVRLPVHLHEVMMKSRKAEKELQSSLQREPTQAEIADRVGITEQRLHELRKLHKAPTALEAPVGKEGDATVADMIQDDSEETAEDAATMGMMTKDMENLLYTLSEREGDVLRLRYGLDDGREKTLEEVGRILLVTRERIRQIEFKALRKLKEPQRCSVLKTYTLNHPDGNRRGTSRGMSGSRSK
ncbi:hypothetical protein ABBQ38_002831 [Trebouxia sp. C0009 RCD-2024]